jgi:hypothetical protein
MRQRWAIVSASAALFACGRGDAPPDSTTRRGATTAAGADWVAELGPTLLIQGDSQAVALSVNSALPAPATPTLSIRLAPLGGAFGPAVSGVVHEADSAGCDAPRVAIAGRVRGDWTVGVAASGVASVPLDSIEALPAPDSAALASDVARVASMLAPPDSKLRGLPFVALKAYRIRDGGRTTLLATVLRRLPQEANPLEARGFVIGESSNHAPFTLSYGVRSEGSEETVEHVALLGVLRAGGKEFAVIEREQENATRYEILERAPSGDWRVRWSRVFDC